MDFTDRLHTASGRLDGGLLRLEAAAVGRRSERAPRGVAPRSRPGKRWLPAPRSGRQ